MQIQVDLDDIRRLCPNVTILNYNKGWYTVAEQTKKVHGYKQLRQLDKQLQEQSHAEQQSTHNHHDRQHQSSSDLSGVRGNRDSDEPCEGASDDAVYQWLDSQERAANDSDSAFADYQSAFADFQSALADYQSAVEGLVAISIEISARIEEIFGNGLPSGCIISEPDDFHNSATRARIEPTTVDVEVIE